MSLTNNAATVEFLQAAVQQRDIVISNNGGNVSSVASAAATSTALSHSSSPTSNGGDRVPTALKTLWQAITIGDLTSVKVLLSYEDVDCNRIDTDGDQRLGCTALHLAVLEMPTWRGSSQNTSLTNNNNNNNAETRNHLPSQEFVKSFFALLLQHGASIEVECHYKGEWYLQTVAGKTKSFFPDGNNALGLVLQFIEITRGSDVVGNDVTQRLEDIRDVFLEHIQKKAATLNSSKIFHNIGKVNYLSKLISANAPRSKERKYLSSTPSYAQSQLMNECIGDKITSNMFSSPSNTKTTSDDSNNDASHQQTEVFILAPSPYVRSLENTSSLSSSSSSSSDNSSSTVAQDMRNLMESPISKGSQKSLQTSYPFADATLRCNGVEFSVNKIVLASRSKVFNAMFSFPTKEMNSPVEIEDVQSVQAFKSFIHFLYTDELALEILQQENESIKGNTSNSTNWMQQQDHEVESIVHSSLVTSTPRRVDNIPDSASSSSKSKIPSLMRALQGNNSSNGNGNSSNNLLRSSNSSPNIDASAVSREKRTSRSWEEQDESDDDEQEDMMNLLKEILVLSNRYDVEPLKQVCSHILASAITSQNALELLQLADVANAKDLKSATLDFLAENCDPSMNQSKYLELEKHLLIDIISSMARLRSQRTVHVNKSHISQSSMHNQNAGVRSPI